MTACENQIRKASESESDSEREVFVDFASVQDHEDQYFWLKYLKCYGQFIPVNIDLKFASIFEKVAFGGQPCNTTSAFKGALEFVDRVGNDRAIVLDVYKRQEHLRENIRVNESYAIQEVNESQFIHFDGVCGVIVARFAFENSTQRDKHTLIEFLIKVHNIDVYKRQLN